MSEPTLKDVLDAIAELAEGQTTLATRIDKIDAKVDTLTGRLERVESKVEAHRAETAAHRAETRQAFADVETYVAQHVVTHRALDDRLDKIEARLPPPRPAARAPRRR